MPVRFLCSTFYFVHADTIFMNGQVEDTSTAMEYVSLQPNALPLNTFVSNFAYLLPPKVLMDVLYVWPLKAHLNLISIANCELRTWYTLKNLVGRILLSLTFIVYCFEQPLRQHTSRVSGSGILIGWFHPGTFGSHANVWIKAKHPNASISDANVRIRFANVRMRTENNQFASEIRMK